MAERVKEAKITVLSNPRGGANQKQGLGALTALCEKRGIQHMQASTADEIKAQLEILSKDPPNIFVINSGDGTIDMVIRLMRNHHYFETEPALVLLQGGTTNMIHLDVGLNGKPAAAFETFLDTQHPNVAERQPLEIRQAVGDTLYGFFMGTGALPRAIKKTRTTFHSRGMKGKLSEALSIFSTLMRLKFRPRLAHDKVLYPSRLHLSIDEEDMSIDHVFMALTSLQTLILRIQSPADDDNTGIILMGPDRKIRRMKAESVTIDTDEEWVLDGEFYDAGRLAVSRGAPLYFLTL